MLFWGVVLAFLLAVASCEYYAWRTGVPTMTSWPSVRKKMIELIVAEASERPKAGPVFRVLDLGSGTGKLSLEIGRALPQAEIVGIELSVVPYYLSLIRCALWRVPNATYCREDFWHTDISGYDAVVIYMTSKIRDRMSQKLRDELSPGALVLVNETHLSGGWSPSGIHRVGLMGVEVVVYRKK